MRQAPAPRRSNRNKGGILNAAHCVNKPTTKVDISFRERLKYTANFTRETEFSNAELDACMSRYYNIRPKLSVYKIKGFKAEITRQMHKEFDTNACYLLTSSQPEPDDLPGKEGPKKPSPTEIDRTSKQDQRNNPKKT